MLDGNALLSPEFAAAAGTFPAFGVATDNLAIVRQAIVELAASAPTPADPPEVTTIDHQVPGSDAIVRVYRPRGLDGVLPGFYSMHGGGYVLGSYELDNDRVGRWCQQLGCVGFSVEYRLAPETPYPGPLEDCYDGLRWVHEHHDELGVDPTRLGIGGLSAGGGLAAALALLARDRGELPVAFQLLESPMLDDRQVTPSSRLPALLAWTRESNTFGWRSYLGDLYGADDVPYTAAPARATDLTGLPPALVAVGGADGFRDEDVDYAQRLAQADVPTELHVYPGAPHGAPLFEVEGARRWNRDVREWLSAQLHPATA
jgi:acetyl esterase/lipase